MKRFKKTKKFKKEQKLKELILEYVAYSRDMTQHIRELIYSSTKDEFRRLDRMEKQMELFNEKLNHLNVWTEIMKRQQFSKMKDTQSLQCETNETEISSSFRIDSLPKFFETSDRTENDLSENN